MVITRHKILRLWTSQNSTCETVILVLTSLSFHYNEGKVSDNLVRFHGAWRKPLRVTSSEHQANRIGRIRIFGAAPRLNGQLRGIVLSKDDLVRCVIIPLQIWTNRTKSEWLLFLELVESMGHKHLAKNWICKCTEEFQDLHCQKRDFFYHRYNQKPKVKL